MIRDNKCCSDVIKKHFNKELLKTKENNENFKNFTKCWISGKDYLDNGVKVRDNYHITCKCRDSVHGDSNINLELNQEIPAICLTP